MTQSSSVPNTNNTAVDQQQQPSKAARYQLPPYPFHNHANEQPQTLTWAQNNNSNAVVSDPNSNNSSGNNTNTANNVLQQMLQDIQHIPQLPVFFQDKKHEHMNCETPRNQLVDWRMSQKLKTVHVALVMCLNIGVDPPDVIRVHPCAKLEAWTDPFTLPHQRALETIGAALKSQYERWQPRARYKQCLDPTVEEVKKTCINLRRSAKKERVLFHYNGHGVPKPSNNGEIWVFNKTFTQYIPLSLYDLSSWMESPSIYVFDCSSAGTVLDTFLQVFKQKETRGSKSKENIILAACGVNETLPMNPNFPADLFTACLTTPIKVALKWFCENNRLLNNITMDMIDNIPGQINDRRTPLGELNWIFTAVTDTIAWSMLPRDLFHKLFRQDLLVASLFRNFLLADRIMRTVNCTPVTYPKLPATHNHEMWAAWDLALDMCISQLPKLNQGGDQEYEYSSFFASQLTDFQVWLDFGHQNKQPPKQLPILLQVLLSQAHRLRALSLLGRFLDMGPWAVNLALSVGIFPYVLKLLQSNSPELKQILVFIWAKILTLDQSCQVDLVKENGHIYFINIIANKAHDAKLKAMACFVLSVIANKFSPGQSACLQSLNILNTCVGQLTEKNSHLRQWLCLLIGKLIENFPDAQAQAFNLDIHEKVSKLLTDRVPEVRAAAVFCLQSFIRFDAHDNQGKIDLDTLSEERILKEMQVGGGLYQAMLDGSPLVRRELVYALATFIDRYAEYIPPDLLRTIIEEHTASSLSPCSPDRQSDNSFAFLTAPLKKSKSKKKQKKNSQSISPSTSPHMSRSEHITGHVDVSAPKDMKDRDLGKRSYFALDVCRVILMLCSDPLPYVSTPANLVLRYMKKNFLRHSSDDGERGSSRSSRTLATSPPTQRSKSPLSRQVISPKPNRLSARFLMIRKSASEADISKVSQSQPQAQATETEESLHLPVTQYYEWCSEYFTTPLLAENQIEKEVPVQKPNDTTNANFGAVTKKALLRKRRQDHLIYERQMLVKNVSHPSVARRKLEDQIGFFGNQTDIVSQMKFHSTEPWLVVSDHRDGIILWDWTKGEKVSSWNVASTLKAQPHHILHHTQSAFIGTTSNTSLSDEDSFEDQPLYLSNELLDSTLTDMRITDMQFVNEQTADERSLLLVATSRGNVCLYSNYHRRRPPRMITALKAAPEVISRDHGPGVLTTWQQRTGTLIVGGDLEYIKIWDMTREWCVQSLPLYSPNETDNMNGGACVTSLTTDQSHNNEQVFVAGLSDGSLFVFDKRVSGSGSAKFGRVAKLKEKGDDDWIVNVQMQKTSSTQIISGSSGGIVKIWDMRIDSSVKTFNVNDSSGTSIAADTLLNIDENLLSGGIGGATSYAASSSRKANQRSCMTALAVHDYAPIIACGSNNQFIKVLNTSGETLSMIYYHDGFLGQRIGPVSSLAFHPYRPYLAAGSTDAIISVYGPPPLH